MFNISYDTKPLGSIQRVRMNVIDSFINEEKVLLSTKILELLNKGICRKQIKKLYDKTLESLEKELENKRLFQIRLKGILSFRLPESIIFINELNENNIYKNNTISN
jgi:hypothetical protein